MASCVIHKSSTLVIQQQEQQQQPLQQPQQKRTFFLSDVVAIAPKKRTTRVNVNLPKRLTTNVTYFCIYNISSTVSTESSENRNGIGPRDSDFNLRKSVKSKPNRFLERIKKKFPKMFRRRQRNTLLNRFAINRIFSHHFSDRTRVITTNQSRLPFLLILFYFLLFFFFAEAVDGRQISRPFATKSTVKGNYKN